LPITDITHEAAQMIDGDLVKPKLSASRRRNWQITLRTLCRFFAERRYLTERPRFPKLPKVIRFHGKPWGDWGLGRRSPGRRRPAASTTSTRQTSPMPSGSWLVETVWKRRR